MSRMLASMSRMLALGCALAAFTLAAGPASAQQPTGTQQPAPPPPYGPPITLEQAKRVMAAELEAAKNSWQVAIAILDSGGNMVMFHKLDNTQLASIGASEGKANAALRFKRPSKVLDEAIAAGGAGLRLLAIKGITPLEGGLPSSSTERSSARSASPALAGHAGGAGGGGGGGEVDVRPSGPIINRSPKMRRPAHKGWYSSNGMMTLRWV
jgi:glc operon protein GlcG